MTRVIVFPKSRNVGGWWILLVAVLIFVALLFFRFWGTRSALAPEAPPSGMEDRRETSLTAAVLTIIFGGEKGTRRFSGEVVEGMTVADALFQAARAGNFSVEFRNDGSLSTIDRIDGVWVAERNGVPINAPLTEVPITAGDTVTLRHAGE